MNFRDPHAGRFFSLFYTFNKNHSDEIVRFGGEFHFSNPLNPMLYPDLVEMEKDIVRFSKELMHAPSEAEGLVTSGGTESISIAMKSYRDSFRRKRQNATLKGVIVIADSAHPAFKKAAEWLDLEIARIPLDENFRMNLESVSALISERSEEILAIVGSAPQFAQGVVDDILSLGRMAEARSIPLHVDACIGGFILPFLSREPDLFDFRIPGVTSISLDPHKYAYALKGVSVLIFRSGRDRDEALFVDTDWNGSPFATSGFLGSRSGAPLAAAWKSLSLLKGEGFKATTAEIEAVVTKFRGAIEISDELEVVGDPAGPVLSIRHRSGKSRELYRFLQEKKWVVDWVREPESIHFSFSPIHAETIEELISDLKEFSLISEHPGESNRSPGAYFDAPGLFIRAGFKSLYRTGESV